MQQLILSDYIRAVWKRKFSCCLIIATMTLATIGFSFLLPEVYRAEGTILPGLTASSQGVGITGLLAMLGGGGSPSGAPNELIIYLNSRALQERIVKSLDLISHFYKNGRPQDLTETQILEEACRQLSGMVAIKKDRVYLEKILIVVESENPELAAKIAKQYLVELQNFISNHALTQAKRQRLFLEGQLAKNKEEVLKMGKALAVFYGQNAVSESQAKLNVPVAVAMEAGKVRSFKDYEEFKRYFDVLQKKELDPESTQKLQYVRDVPHQVYLKYLTIQQQILEQNAVILSQSYEMAKMEEAKQEPSFQILDEPVTPRYRFKPQRRVMAQGAFALSTFLAILYAFYMEFRKNTKWWGSSKPETVGEQTTGEYEWGATS